MVEGPDGLFNTPTVFGLNNKCVLKELSHLSQLSDCLIGRFEFTSGVFDHIVVNINVVVIILDAFELGRTVLDASR